MITELTFKSRVRAAFLVVGTKASDNDWAALLNSTCTITSESDNTRFMFTISSIHNEVLASDMRCTHKVLLQKLELVLALIHLPDDQHVPSILEVHIGSRFIPHISSLMRIGRAERKLHSHQ